MARLVGGGAGAQGRVIGVSARSSVGAKAARLELSAVVGSEPNTVRLERSAVVWEPMGAQAVRA
jgi:hypothetical protein